MLDLSSKLHKITFDDNQNLKKVNDHMEAMKMASLMVNWRATACDFSVISVLMVPISYFLYSLTSGSMTSYQTEGKSEIMIMAV